MDLLGEENKKKKKTQGQKIVLTLLIISIVLCLIIGVAILYLSMQTSAKEYTILVDGIKTLDTSLGLFNDENGKQYASLKKLSSVLGYNYCNGEFDIVGEEKNKGYIENGSDIIQFFSNSKEIYKTEQDANTDYQYYNLDNKIIEKEDGLYICLDDLDIALNLITNYSEANNQTTIKTVGFLKDEYSKKVGENITISDDAKNLKALAYGYIVINKDGKYGILNLNGEELVGNKYNSITFCEYTGNFIVSNINGKFGVITGDGSGRISLQYDSVEIINYNPLLYKVEKSDKFGIMKENEDLLNEIQYNSIGYPGNESINYTLIIPNLNESIPKSIVVCKDNKYGLIDLESGEEIIECNLTGIYSITYKDGKDYYIVETQNGQRFLDDYVKNLNKITVTID